MKRPHRASLHKHRKQSKFRKYPKHLKGHLSHKQASKSKRHLKRKNSIRARRHANIDKGIQSNVAAAVVLTTAIVAAPVDDVLAATNGDIGQTSTGSFAITLVVEPSVEATVTRQQADDQGQSQAVAANTMFENEAVDLCVDANGVDQYRLQVEGHEVVAVNVDNPGEEIVLGDAPSQAFDASQNCAVDGQQLIAKNIRDGGENTAAILTISPE